MDEARNEASSRQWALLPLRLVVGYGFMAHGLAKWSRGPDNFGKLLQQVGVPLPTATAWMVTLLEVFGGLAILAGVLITLASVPLIVSQLVAMFTVQLRYGFSSVNTIGLTATGPVFGPPGYEINLLYIASLLALALLGPGPLSAERLLANRRGKEGRSERGKEGCHPERSEGSTSNPREDHKLRMVSAPTPSRSLS